MEEKSKKLNLWFLVIIACVLLGVVLIIINRRNFSVGGDKDEHGCLVAAGYSWCEARQECERNWERYCTDAVPKVAPFACADGKSIIATFYPSDDKYVDLVLSDGRALSVPHAISASGARYAREDESFVFWNKGNTAFVTENGTTTFDGCITETD